MPTAKPWYCRRYHKRRSLIRERLFVNINVFYAYTRRCLDSNSAFIYGRYLSTDNLRRWLCRIRVSVFSLLRSVQSCGRTIAVLPSAPYIVVPRYRSGLPSLPLRIFRPCCVGRHCRSRRSLSPIPKWQELSHYLPPKVVPSLLPYVR